MFLNDKTHHDKEEQMTSNFHAVIIIRCVV